MTVANGELLKSVATLTLPGDVICQNVFYHVLSAAADRSYSDVMDVIEDELEAIYNALATYTKSTVVLDDVITHVWEWSVTPGWHTGRLVGVRTLTDSFAGSGDMLPHACVGVITGFTQDVLVRSRKSFSGLAEGHATDSSWNSTILTILVNAAAEWLSDRILSGTDAIMPIVPSKDGGWEYLLTMLVSDIIGSQRQRKPGEGI